VGGTSFLSMSKVLQFFPAMNSMLFDIADGKHNDSEDALFPDIGLMGFSSDCISTHIPWTTR
jgi:hypothetical protein